MKTALVEIMREFSDGEIDAPSFVTRFQTTWKQLRDAGELAGPNGRIFDRAFTAADCYSPVPKNLWEINADRLRAEITDLATLIIP